MRKFLAKDIRYRKQYSKNEIFWLVIKTLFLNVHVPGYKRRGLRSLQNLYQLLDSQSNRMKLRTYCTITGRSRGIFKDYRLSRFIFKRFGSLGYIPGLVRRFD